MESKCLVCLSSCNGSYKESEFAGGDTYCSCQACGTFLVTWEAKDDYLIGNHAKVTKIVRASVSHWIRTNQSKVRKQVYPRVDSAIMEAALTGKLVCPNPAEQAINILICIGEHISRTGEPMSSFGHDFYPSVGSYSHDFATKIVKDLVSGGLVIARDSSNMDSRNFMEIYLSLTGWEVFQKEKIGKISGNYGFFASKFGDPTLDKFLHDEIRPAIESIGYDLRDMRTVTTVGIIDNLLRMQIRDSKFVVVDLSHDNLGAYWEAGYAEGLGKPVLYICEKNKFEESKTHFDTNHCTTVCWDVKSPEIFCSELIATLKRSLVL